MTEISESEYYFSEKKITILTISLVGFLFHIIFIIHFMIKIKANKGKQGKTTTLEKFLLVLSLIEAFISLSWVLTEIFFDDPSLINSFNCKILGGFQTFFYLFDWVLVYFTISYLKNIIINPINFIFKSKKKTIKYFTISFLVSAIIIAIFAVCDFFGKSPMLTCLVNIDKIFSDIEDAKVIIGLVSIIICILIFPIVNLVHGIIEIIIVCKHSNYKNDKENQKFFFEHSLYYLTYFIMNIFIPILYIIAFITYFIKEEIYDEISQKILFGVSILVCMTPLVVGTIRLYYAKTIKKICRCKKYDRALDIRGSLLPMHDDEIYKEFENKVVDNFVMDIYIAVCYCLEKDMILGDIKYDYLHEEMNIDSMSYRIDKDQITNENYTGRLIHDRLVNDRIDFSISCVEYAPTIFKYMRKLDGLKEEEIVQSMLPMNNKSGISGSEGRGGSFFAYSDDQEFILKTITFQELEIIRNLLLNKMVKYFYENDDSIISRIYGVYKISMETGIFTETDMYFILMKNIIGSFNKNVMVKFDLKGSILNRKVEYEGVCTKVMKDVNFNETEKVFLFNKENSEKLMRIAKRDAEFFCDSGIMDYSLLVAKVSLNNDEMMTLLGKDHRKEVERDFLTLIGKENEYPNNTNNFIQEDILDNNGEKNIRFAMDKIGNLRKYFFPSLKADVLYIISIIDFFQLYTLQKNLETKIKKIAKGAKEHEISSLPPREYKDRFVDFVNAKTNQKTIKSLFVDNIEDDWLII